MHGVAEGAQNTSEAPPQAQPARNSQPHQQDFRYIFVKIRKGAISARAFGGAFQRC